MAVIAVSFESHKTRKILCG